MEQSSAEFWQAVSALSSTVLIVITGIYAYLTHRMAKAAESQSWEVNRATVIARLNINQGSLFLLEIVNIGNSNALNLKVHLNKAVHPRIGEKADLRQAPLFKNGLDCFPPSSPIYFGLGLTFEWLGDSAPNEKHPSDFAIELSYSTGGRTINDTISVNITDQFQASSGNRNYIDDFGREFPRTFSRKMDELILKTDRLSDKTIPLIHARKSWSGWFTKTRSREKWLSRW